MPRSSFLCGLHRTNFSLMFCLIAVAAAHSEPGKIEITKATYGDERYTCSPDLAFCNGLALCGFIVGDTLCVLDDNAGPARNLEVEYFCGAPLPPKAKAAAKGTRMEIDCQY